MHTIQELVRNISDGARAAHAFAVEGRAGESRDAFITSLAAGLECAAEPGARPCGRCPACLQAAAGTSMDIVRMSKSAGSSGTGRETYKVADASAFTERLSMGAYGRYLIGIIDDADSLSETIQNKMLKTLEEPAPDTILLLAVTNLDNLLSTVRSRVSVIRLADYAQDTGEDTETADESDGKTETLKSTAQLFISGNTAFHELRSAVDKSIKSREDALALLEVLEDDIRDMMIETGSGRAAGSAERYADAIERICIARMDIRRDMNHIRALKRLYLELKG